MIVENAKISWKIGIRKSHNLLEGDYEDFKLLSNPWWGWCADPFLFEYENKIYIFAEVWNYFKQRGGIGYFQITGKETDYKWHMIIQERYHMSYPMVWKDHKGIHLCAETCGNNDLHLYHGIDFPNKWEKEAVLLSNMKLADSTFWFDTSNEPKYCFTYEIKGINKGILYQYKMNDFAIINNSGKIITEDPSIARPGGMFFVNRNKIYRVAQDCSKSYGQNLCFLEVVSIEPYKEKINTIVSYQQFPEIKHCIGVHTYSRLKDYETIDFRLYKFGLINFIGTYMRFAARRIKRAFKKYCK